jgi:hypothetical protein
MSTAQSRTLAFVGGTYDFTNKTQQITPLCLRKVLNPSLSFFLNTVLVVFHTTDAFVFLINIHSFISVSFVLCYKHFLVKQRFI